MDLLGKGGWEDKGPGREMFECHWGVLKGRVKVRLGEMPGVACLGKKTEISEG